MSVVTGRTCPYCLTTVDGDIPSMSCPVCGIPHHAECWRENGGCTTLPPMTTQPPRAYPAASPTRPAPASSRAVTSLLLGILGVLCACLMVGMLFAVPAWIVGATELRNVRAGLSSPASESVAQA